MATDFYPYCMKIDAETRRAMTYGAKAERITVSAFVRRAIIAEAARLRSLRKTAVPASPIAEFPSGSPVDGDQIETPSNAN